MILHNTTTNNTTTNNTMQDDITQHNQLCLNHSRYLLILWFKPIFIRLNDYFMFFFVTAADTSPRESSPLLEAQETAGSPQVCVMLQPPLPSLAGSRSSSPTQKGSLSDVAQTPPVSMPIILAPSPLSRIPISQEIASEVPKDETRVLVDEPLANNSEVSASEGTESVIRDV